jgi:hypothetical protein
VYCYSLSCELILVYFLPIKYCFIVGLPLDVGFEMELITVAVVWRTDIDLVMLEGT